MKKRIGKRSISVMSMMLAVVLAVGLMPGKMVFAADLTQEDSVASDVSQQEGTTPTDSELGDAEESTEQELSTDADIDSATKGDALSPNLLSAIQPLAAEVAPMATDWTGEVLPANTTLTILTNGTFYYNSIEYSFATNGSSTITADGNLTIILNNTTPVKVKNITVDNSGNLTVSGAGEMSVEGDGIWYTIQVGDSLIVNGATLKASGDSTGVFAFGSITLENGGVLSGAGTDRGILSASLIVDVGCEAHGTSTASDGTAVQSDAITVSDGTVTGTSSGEYSSGVFSYNTLISSGSMTGTSTGKYSTGVQSSMLSVENSGDLTGFGGVVGVRGRSIEVIGNSKLVGKATTENSTGYDYYYYPTGVEGSVSIVVDGEGSSVEGMGNYYGVHLVQMVSLRSTEVTPLEIEVDSGSIVAQNGGLLTGTGGSYGIYNEYYYSQIIAKSDGEIIGTGDEFGVAVSWGLDAGIRAETGGAVTGMAPHFGVHGTDSTISADGSDSVVLGIATATDRLYEDEYGDFWETSAVMSDVNIAPQMLNVEPASNQAIGATNGGLIWEDYPNILVAFNDVTPVYPYDNGVNVFSIANYDWMPDLEVDGAVTGLLALRGYVDTQDIMGARIGEAAGEFVSLDADSMHIITFLGTLDGPMNPVDPPVDPEDPTDITTKQTSTDSLAKTGDSFPITMAVSLLSIAVLALAGSCMLRKRKMN